MSRYALHEGRRSVRTARLMVERHGIQFDLYATKWCGTVKLQQKSYSNTASGELKS